MDYATAPAIIGPLRERLARIAFDRGGLIGLATLVLYLWVAPAHIVDGDNAEFSTVGAVGGVAHPSGYPLFVLWLRATSWLPSESPAHAAALATAVLGGVMVVVLHAACRAWGARPTVATITVAIFAAAPVVIRISTEAEVFALNALLVSSVVFLAARNGPLRGVQRVAALGLVAGLGLSDHLTCVLIAPIGLLGAVRGIREATIPRAASIAIGIAALAIGLTPYIYLVVAPEGPIPWSRIDGLAGVVRHFLRLDYGGPGTFSPNRDAVPALDSLAALARMLGRTWLWAPAAAGLVTLIMRVSRRSNGETRWAWSMLGLSFALAGPILVARFNVPPEGIGLVICHRFHLLPALLLALPIASAFDELAERSSQRITSRAVRSRSLVTMIAIAGFAALAAVSLPKHSPAVERGIVNMLRSLPADSVVIVTEDDLIFGSAYVQMALGIRRDVAVIVWPQLRNPYYIERLPQRSGLAAPPRGDKTPSLTLAETALAQNRPLFVDPYQKNIITTYPTYPYGLLFRVLPLGSPRPHIDEVFAINKQVYESFQFDYPIPREGDDYAAKVHWRYVRMWSIIAEALMAARRREDAAFANEMIRVLGPTP